MYNYSAITLIALLFASCYFSLSEATISFRGRKAQTSTLTLATGMTISFQSLNYPDHYIRHKNYELWSDVYESSDLYKHDSSFKVQPANNGKAGYFSFESTNYPGRFWRHSNYLGYIHPSDGTQLFNEDSSFKVNCNDQGVVTLESSNYPGYFIRHQSWRVKISQTDNTDLFRMDSSWRILTGGNLAA